MKKNIVRITESELRQYIQKAINEQSQPNSSVNELLNKNVQLYIDKNKLQKSHMVKIVKINSDAGDSITFEVQDLNFTSDIGTSRPSAQDGKGKITKMIYSCKNPNYLHIVQDGKGVVNFSPSFTIKLKGLLNCQPTQISDKPVDPFTKPKVTVVKNVADFK